MIEQASIGRRPSAFARASNRADPAPGLTQNSAGALPATPSSRFDPDLGWDVERDDVHPVGDGIECRVRAQPFDLRQGRVHGPHVVALTEEGADGAVAELAPIVRRAHDRHGAAGGRCRHEP